MRTFPLRPADPEYRVPADWAIHSRRRVIATLLGLALLLPAASAPADEAGGKGLADIPARMQRFVARGQIAGAVTVVGRHDQVLSYEAVGLRDREATQPMTKDTLFRIASMTKPITAVGIMILVDEGKLALDDPVEKHLPEFRGLLLAIRQPGSTAMKMLASRQGDSIVLKPPARKITVRDLLTHTSGLPSGLPPFLADLYMKRDRTLAEATRLYAQKRLEFEPGSRWAYCNLGIDTLGRIIEVASGRPYEKFLQERVFKPLDMTDTTFYPDDGQRRRMAVLYDSRQGKLVAAGYQILGPSDKARFPIPAGGLYATGADLACFYQMMLCRGECRGTRILTEKSVRQMTSVQTGELPAGFTLGMGFGLGWGVVRQPWGVTEGLSPGAFGHTGAFGTHAWIDPKQDLFVVLLIQRVGLLNPNDTDMARDLLGLAAGTRYSGSAIREKKELAPAGR